jgi:hypothetical protein
MKTKTTGVLKQLVLVVLVITNIFVMVKVNAQNLSQNDQGTNYQGNFLTNIVIYPRPTHDFVIMKAEVTTPSNIDMRIIDILGRALIERTETASVGLYQHNFDLSNYPNGIYLLEIRCGNQTVTTRLIKN